MNLKTLLALVIVSKQSRATDDLVMALIIAVRMTEYISAFEDDVYNAVNSSLSVDPNDPDSLDDSDYPMPIGLL